MLSRRTDRNALIIVVVSLVSLGGLFRLHTFAESPAATSKAQDARFAKLEESLSGVALVGNFSETGSKEAKLQAERYELKNVKHVGDNQWLFEARIKYGDHDVTLPLTLPVYWADDTPVISVTNFPIPGLGTYTARVMIYADHYAGFWRGAGHGGHLFGVVQREQE